MAEAAPAHGREAVLALLSEMLAVARAGLRLYREGVAEAPTEIGDRLREYGEECHRHVDLIEETIRELGGDPAEASAEAQLVQRVSELFLRETGVSNRRWFYRLEGLLAFETRDAIISEALAAVAAASDDPTLRDAVHRGALTVRSGAALGAHDVSRPSERIDWLENTMRTIVLDEYGVKAPSRWERLTRGY